MVPSKSESRPSKVRVWGGAEKEPEAAIVDAAHGKKSFQMSSRYVQEKRIRINKPKNL
jgi:hypothetical protein